MTSAAVVFCCVIALAFLQGFGAPAFVGAIASDAINATLPFLGLLVVARFAEKRMPTHARTVRRVHVVMQAMLLGMAYGWWWVEPHAILTSLTGGSLVSMAWQALAGGFAGLVLALAADRAAERAASPAERAASPTVMREVGLGAWALLLIGGGRAYRAFDHVEAGVRLEAAGGIVAVVAILAVTAYLLLRRRERLAGAFPALAPALATLALLVAAHSSGPQAPSTRDSIILVVVDTLRADIADEGMAGVVTGSPADRTNAMPELARIATQGVRFTQAVSPAPWTLPATVSLLSGWNPHRHQFGASASAWEVLRGDPRALYLGDAMRDAGYLTAGFVNNPYLRPWFGFDAGYYDWRPYHGRAVDGVAMALEWLHDHAAAASFTLLHLMDPHWPYEAPPGFGAERQPCAACDSLLFAQFTPMTSEQHAELRRRYAAEVQYTDAMLGRFYDTLAAGGVLDHTWLVITADHGEEFWEHGGFMHGQSLYDELLRVPLVVVPPRARADMLRGVRIATQVRLEDVASTMLDIAGIDAHRAPDGQTLLGLLQGKPDIYARVEVAGFVKAADDLSYAVRRPPWKSVVSPVITGNRLFQLNQDPGEQHNLLFDPQIPALRRPELSQRFYALLAEPKRLGLSVSRERVESGGSLPDRDTQRSLRSLGYAH